MELIVENLPLLLALGSAGLFAGLVAGLFGIGGGAVIVPVLYFLLGGMGFDETAQHVAVATSLATIIATSSRSVMAHHKRGAVDWGVLKAWSPWIVLGALIGMVLAGFMSGRALTILVGGVALIIALQFFFGRPDWRLADDLATGLPRAGLGGAMGTLSALMGIGGGTFGVSLMTMSGRPIHQAIGTAAGFGVAIGVPGAIAAIFTGWGKSGLPPGSLGYVNLPAFIMISVLTVTMAPIGAAVAHRLDGVVLKKAFGVLLAIVAGRMIYASIAG